MLHAGIKERFLTIRNLTSLCTMDISVLKKPYNSEGNEFTENDIPIKDPFYLFEKWFKEAEKNEDILEANVASVATATKNGLPSNRFLLCRGFGKDVGFKFFSSYDSKKGIEIEENPHAAICFYWAPLKKAVRVEGTVEKLSSKESEEYFKSKPYYSQIAVCLEKQGQPIEGIKVIEQLEKEFIKKYPEGCVPKPDYWGGFSIIPNRFEFWQGQTTRLHDRIGFRKAKPNEIVDEKITHTGSDGWLFERLFP